MAGDGGEVGGAEVRRPFRGPRGRRGLQGGLQPAAPAVSLLQRQRTPAARARPGPVAAGEVTAAPAHPGIQDAPGQAHRAAGSGGTVRGGAHAGGSDRPFYSGKHRKHGMNLQVIASPDGEIVRVSGPLPGAVHDLTAARIWSIIAELAASGLAVLADKGPHRCWRPRARPVRGQEQARLAEGRQPGSCPATRSGRPRQRPAQVLAHLAQASLLPLAGWPAGQSHPCSSGPRNRRMKKVHCNQWPSSAIRLCMATIRHIAPTHPSTRKVRPAAIGK